MSSVPPALVDNAGSFHMTNAGSFHMTNAACFHTSNAAQQGTSTAVDQHQWRWIPWGPYPCHPEPSIQAGNKRQRTESQHSDSDGTDEDDINPYLTESEHRDLLSDSQSDTDSDSEQDEPPAERILSNSLSSARITGIFDKLFQISARTNSNSAGIPGIYNQFCGTRDY